MLNIDSARYLNFTTNESTGISWRNLSSEILLRWICHSHYKKYQSMSSLVNLIIVDYLFPFLFPFYLKKKIKRSSKIFSPLQRSTMPPPPYDPFPGVVLRHKASLSVCWTAIRHHWSMAVYLQAWARQRSRYPWRRWLSLCSSHSGGVYLDNLCSSHARLSGQHGWGMAYHSYHERLLSDSCCLEFLLQKIAQYTWDD